MSDTIHIDPYYGIREIMMQRFDSLARKDFFRGNTTEDFDSWRQKSRHSIADLLGLDKMRSCPTQARSLERETLADGIVREKIVIMTEPGVEMPFFLLIPPVNGDAGNANSDQNPERKRPCALALPGHQGAGKYSVAGCSEIPAVAAAISKFQYDYGLRLAQKGYVTVCPDVRGFGERREPDLQADDPDSFRKGSCRALAHMALPLGMTVAGMCLWDHMRLIDYLEERGDLDLSDLLCVGFSGGGMHAMWLAAMDDRVKRVIISGYMYGFRDAHLYLNGNCDCNYVPHLWEHFDCGDLISMIAPRSLIIQSCRGDHLNGPRGLENVEEQMEIIRRAYRLYGAEDVLIHDIREGEHCFHPEVLERIENR